MSRFDLKAPMSNAEAHKWRHAGYKAANTRKRNALQREYETATSAGVKAGIKRKINALQEEYNAL